MSCRQSVHVLQILEVQAGKRDRPVVRKVAPFRQTVMTKPQPIKCQSSDNVRHFRKNRRTLKSNEPYCSGFLRMISGIPCGRTLCLSLRGAVMLRIKTHRSVSSWIQGITVHLKTRLRQSMTELNICMKEQTHFSRGLSTLYHPLLTPESRISSNPGVKS
jgi:hypothetical protein